MNDPEVMAQWNQAADRVAAANDTEFDFTWTVPNMFPHPTYKGGSPEAYRECGQILAHLAADVPNFDWSTRICHILSGGAGFDGTFATLQGSVEEMAKHYG